MGGMNNLEFSYAKTDLMEVAGKRKGGTVMSTGTWAEVAMQVW